MGFSDFRARMLAGERLVGTFVKTPAHEMVELLGRSGMDFICLDAEHGPFDRGRMDACLAVARAMDFPTLVRVPVAAPETLLMALDAGAAGVVCPHVASAERAAMIARAARYGPGGRGFAGSTRWTGFGEGDMGALIRRSAEETVVIAQIEEPEGVEAVEEIAATEGIDGLFIGPADLSVGYGHTSQSSPELTAAYARVGRAAKAAGCAHMTYVSDESRVAELAAHGVSMFFVSSDQGFMRAGAAAMAKAVRGGG